MKVYLVCSGSCEGHGTDYATLDGEYAEALAKKLVGMRTRKNDGGITETWEESDDLFGAEVRLWTAIRQYRDGIVFTGRIHDYISIEEHELVEKK